MKTSDDIISDLNKLSKELNINDRPYMSNPFQFQGMPIYEVKPRMVPIIQVREDFKWLTDEARARINAKLVELIGCREQCAVPKDRILVFAGNIIARPEHMAMITNCIA